MKVSINNFKTIRELTEFDFKHLNIISGVNSSGKSSFVQFLLLIKQTLDVNAVNAPLVLNGDLIELGSFEEIIYKHKLSEKLSFSITVDDQEYQFPSYGTLKITRFDLSITISSKHDGIVIDQVELKYLLPDTHKKEQFLSFTRKNDAYLAKTNTGLFNNDFYQLITGQAKEELGGKVLFTSIFPSVFTTKTQNQDYLEDQSSQEDHQDEIERILANRKSKYKQLSIEPRVKEIKDFIENQFRILSYIGPLRQKPQDYYLENKKNNEIGTKGQFAASILENEGQNKITYNKINYHDVGISFELKKASFLEAVNYWICDVFKLAKKIYSKKVNDNYAIYVVNCFDVESTIKHVGFGISQLLPIVVEGLRMPVNGILVLEQPEIHLHPKVQALLFDFLYSITVNGKKVIVETHSDHFIVRMRRRIAEDRSNQLINMINFKFVENLETEHYFETVELTSQGSVVEFPKDFIEQQEDYRAIVKAQSRKALRNKE